MSGNFKISSDDPERDNKLTRDSFMRRLCELDRNAMQHNEETRFHLEDIWQTTKGAGLSAFDQDTYSRSIIDEFKDEECIMQHGDSTISLTEPGRRKYCNP
jgi:hypothetical protein